MLKRKKHSQDGEQGKFLIIGNQVQTKPSEIRPNISILLPRQFSIYTNPGKTFFIFKFENDVQTFYSYDSFIKRYSTPKFLRNDKYILFSIKAFHKLDQTLAIIIEKNPDKREISALSPEEKTKLNSDAKKLGYELMQLNTEIQSETSSLIQEQKSPTAELLRSLLNIQLKMNSLTHYTDSVKKKEILALSLIESIQLYSTFEKVFQDAVTEDYENLTQEINKISRPIQINLEDLEKKLLKLINEKESTQQSILQNQIHEFKSDLLKLYYFISDLHQDIHLKKSKWNSTSICFWKTHSNSIEQQSGQMGTNHQSTSLNEVNNTSQVEDIYDDTKIHTLLLSEKSNNIVIVSVQYPFIDQKSFLSFKEIIKTNIKLAQKNLISVIPLRMQDNHSHVVGLVIKKISNRIQIKFIDSHGSFFIRQISINVDGSVSYHLFSTGVDYFIDNLYLHPVQTIHPNGVLGIPARKILDLFDSEMKMELMKQNIPPIQFVATGIMQQESNIIDTGPLAVQNLIDEMKNKGLVKYEEQSLRKRHDLILQTYLKEDQKTASI